MLMQHDLLKQLNPRQVKYLTILGIGLMGIAIALLGYLFSEEQMTPITQVGSDLFHSPVGTVIVSISSFLFS
ncbi:MAG: hypothetical protein GY808_02210 [Gammaproteobacteria bacterium]|nr:hypothetical protein [Gammaproteobacteria bacterium]